MGSGGRHPEHALGSRASPRHWAGLLAELLSPQGPRASHPMSRRQSPLSLRAMATFRAFSYGIPITPFGRVSVWGIDLVRVSRLAAGAWRFAVSHTIRMGSHAPPARRRVACRGTSGE